MKIFVQKERRFLFKKKEDFCSKRKKIMQKINL